MIWLERKSGLKEHFDRKNSTREQPNFLAKCNQNLLAEIHNLSIIFFIVHFNSGNKNLSQILTYQVPERFQKAVLQDRRLTRSTFEGLSNPVSITESISGNSSIANNIGAVIIPYQTIC